MKRSDTNTSGSRVDLYALRPLDVILIIVILLGSAGWLLGSSLDRSPTSNSSKEILIYHDGDLTQRLAANVNQDVSLRDGKMVLEIRDSKIRIKHSDCPRQFCVHQGWVTYDGESIICVPYKTLIEVQSAARPVVDAVIY